MLLILAAAVLAACGGGDGAGSGTGADSGALATPAALERDLPEEDAVPVDYGSGPVGTASAVTETMKALSADGDLAAAELTASYRPTTLTRAAYNAGAFGPVFGWPIIPIHMVQLPDGRVLAYGSDDKGNQGAKLHYAVWDPNWNPGAPGAAPSPFQLLANTTGTDIFCNTQVLLPRNGQVFMAGGDRTVNGIVNYAIADTNFFNPANNSLRREPTDMAYRRWYATAITNARGEVVVLGGRDDRFYAGTATKPATAETFSATPEIYVPGTGWRTLANARSDGAFGELRDNGLYPKAFLAPDGRVVTITNDGLLYALDSSGSGSIARLNGQLPTTNWNTTAVMYAPGKILSARGGKALSLIDINGPQPVIKGGGALSTPRKYGFSTVLPDGTVWFNGGSANGNVLADAVYTTELWNPATNAWRMTANASKPRLYHGNTMLLPSGAVVVGGGGAPGPVIGMNAEVYFPPYFFNPNGTWATQPVIGSVTPQNFGLNATFTMQMSTWGAIDKVVMVRAGAVTHAFNNEQRRMELAFTQAGRTLTVKAPARATEMPPGYYMVFALRKNPQAPAADNRLVPSEAKIVKLS
ncbi:galactose oxidase-like domain-containing protein [Azohydromonas aeria]|uniref:galactose oxidase-like domain-containing protein n=1 Tax=Azohydromonas aeria TaxID=2590212 RepID=UPI0018E002ED|nr:galactose oxidase-like domain-containing protein [Azohydromonas aeria]